MARSRFQHGNPPVYPPENQQPTPALVERLADEGFDPELGARPLQRVVERRVVAALAEFLLAHARVRDCVLSVDWCDGAVRIDVGMK